MVRGTSLGPTRPTCPPSQAAEAACPSLGTAISLILLPFQEPPNKLLLVKSLDRTIIFFDLRCLLLGA